MPDYVDDTATLKEISVGHTIFKNRTGRPSFFHAKTNVTLGGWFNAAKAYMDFDETGKITGKASAFNSEMDVPNQNVSSGGMYCSLEINYNFSASTVLSSNLAHPQCPISINIGGDSGAIDTWEDNLNSGLFHVDGIAEGDGNILSMGVGGGAPTVAGTLRIVIDGATYYLCLASKVAVN